MNGSKFSWNDFFGGTQAATHSSVEYKTRQNPSTSNVYVSNCLFNRCTSDSNGGALCCTTATCFLVESSSFFSCTTSSNGGGAIYFSNTGSGQCVLHKVCGNDCYSTYTSTSNGQFSYIYVYNVASSKNYVNYSSITRCVNQRTHSERMLFLNYGKICCTSVNLSMNKCQYVSGIRVYPFCDSNSVTCLLSYSSFADNNAPDYICLQFETGGAKNEIKCCNILRNRQDSSSNGIIHSNGYSVFQDSCILENIATYIYNVPSSSYSITLSNCTVDKTTNNRNLIIQNTVTKSFILALNHMSTHNCHSGYDSAGTLTAIPYVSHTTKREFCYCYTNKINHYQARVSDFFSFNCVFMVTFIHPNPPECSY
jgi:hypothetical protein